MKMTTFGPLRASATDVKQQIEQAYKDFDGQPQIAILYPSIQTPIVPLVDTIQSIVDIPVIGATTGGAGFTEKGIALTGFVGAFLGGDNSYFHPVLIKEPNGNEEKISQAVKEMVAQKKNSSGHSMFVLANANSFDGEVLIKTITKNIFPHWRILGGFAGDNYKFGETKIFYDKEIVNNGVIVTYINSPTTPGMGVCHGYCSLKDNQEMQVTKIENNLLHELNNRPALDVYLEALQKQQVAIDTSNLATTLTEYSIGIKTLNGENLKIRAPLAVDGKTLILAGSIPHGCKVHITNVKEEDLISSSREATEIAVKNSQTKEPTVQLVIDCASRQHRLAEKYIEEVKAFRISSSIPMLGFTSYGEFARYGGGPLEGFHNKTAVVSIW